MPIEKTLSLQRGNVLHYRCLAGKPEMILDFTRAWRHPFLALLALATIDNALMNVMRDLVAQIVLHFRLNLFLVEEVDCGWVHAVSTEKFAMALIKLPE